MIQECPRVVSRDLRAYGYSDVAEFRPGIEASVDRNLASIVPLRLFRASARVQTEPHTARALE